MYSTIKYEVKESIGYITINRPEALNALNKTVLEELFDVFNKIDADKDIRAVILTGEGRSFVAGLFGTEHVDDQFVVYLKDHLRPDAFGRETAVDIDHGDLHDVGRGSLDRGVHGIALGQATRHGVVRGDVGVKGQSNWEIARTLRNAFRCSL